jgi:hypothetical protein
MTLDEALMYPILRLPYLETLDLLMRYRCSDGDNVGVFDVLMSPFVIRLQMLPAQKKLNIAYLIMTSYDMSNMSRLGVQSKQTCQMELNSI